MNQHSSSQQKYYRPLIGAALAAVSLFHFSLPAFAVGTDAGLELKNRATATYDDGTTTYEIISNEVTVTVGKIAGITNVPDSYTDGNDDVVLPGESVSFDFLVTNTGNDVTKIFIPSASNITTQNIDIDVSDSTSVQYSTDNGATFTDRPADGIIDNIAENDFIIVRVTGTVDALANIGDEIQVRLGDTNGNVYDTTDPLYLETQNQPDAGGASDPQEQDVRTLTGDNANTDVDGDPVNGQREASATHVISVGSNPLALTRIRKTNSGVAISGTPTDLSDDVITYNLSLDVLSSKLARYNNFNFNPAALEGRDYSTVDGGGPSISGTGITDTTNLILISDVIPENTTLDTATVGADVTSPNVNWIPVYTKDDLTTAADEAIWATDPTGAIGTKLAADPVTRIGWVYDANANGTIATNVTTEVFSFKVVTTGADTDPNVYNLAQVFGSTDDGAAGAGGTIVFDESGDENPNNFEDDGTTGPLETVADGSGRFGFPDPGTGEDNVDVDGDNTQTGSSGGEVNKVVVTAGPVTPDLLNGPDGLSGAEGDVFNTGTADDNHDFQNLPAPVPTAANQTVDGSGNPDTTLTADTTITFTNTVENTETGDISNVIIEPISPEDLGLSGTAADLQNGATVVITYDDGTNPVQTATYTYDSSGTGSFTLDSGATVVIPTISGTSAGAGLNTEDYTVTVTLPSGTPLSTNDSVGGYPVPIVAYVDDGANVGTLETDDTYNVTVDQVYLGYLKLEKQARVLEDPDGDGVYTVVAGMDYTDPDTDKFPAPGNIIEYEVTYTNISEDQGTGSNNVILDAENVAITEDGTGTTSPDNNWATDGADDNDSIIDTLHVPNEAVDSNGGAVTYFSGATGSTSSVNSDKEVTKYIDTITNVAPGESGTFTFQRKVTDEDDIEELTP